MYLGADVSAHLHCLVADSRNERGGERHVRRNTPPGVMLAPRPGQLEVLGDQECIKLLKSHDLGRIALVDKDMRPLIFPINYFFDEGIVVFRTAPGAKLDLAPGAHVCFEIDGWNPRSGIGWSVQVKGIAHDLTRPRGMPTARMHYWPVRPMAPGSRQHLIGIWANEITGRRFRSHAQRSTSRGGSRDGS